MLLITNIDYPSTETQNTPDPLPTLNYQTSIPQISNISTTLSSSENLGTFARRVIFTL